MAVTLTQARITEDEFMRLPKDGRKYELVDGEIKEVPTQFEHDVIGYNLIVLIAPSVKGRGFVTTGQAGFRMRNGNIRVPNVSFTRKERVPGGKAPEGFGSVAPDCCVEIISPSEDREEMAHKVQEYFGAGAEQVWHLFPRSQTVTVYTAPGTSRVYAADDELDGAELLPGFRCRVADIFATE